MFKHILINLYRNDNIPCLRFIIGKKNVRPSDLISRPDNFVLMNNVFLDLLMI